MQHILTREQFDILEFLAAENCAAAKLADNADSYSAQAADALRSLGFIDDNGITSSGIAALEPYRVKRAVFIAAGFGSRLAPITLNTPKPLIRVNGIRLIDRLIDAVLAAGIEEIYIVRGYLSEQFDQLLYKYPMIRFIENPDYNKANNISSALCAASLLENAYVFEADLLIDNQSLVRKYHYTSNFLGIWKEASDDWCFTVSDGIITSQKIGGEKCYQEVGISYWNAEDGRKLQKHIKAVFDMLGGKDRYWDQVPFKFFPDEYNVEIRGCFDEDITEIDTFAELKAIDKAYDV